ncbi:MAG: hypothetical protein JSR37_04865 [Verrucomicrobia bacterium]|nr:hypothetical protein [Verrucomicrobiota bacterium]
MKQIIVVFTFFMSALFATPFQVDSITHKIFMPRHLDIDEVQFMESVVATLPKMSFVFYRLPLGMMGYTSHDADGSVNTVYVDGEFGPWDEPSFEGYVEYDLVCK